MLVSDNLALLVLELAHAPRLHILPTRGVRIRYILVARLTTEFKA